MAAELWVLRVQGGCHPGHRRGVDVMSPHSCVCLKPSVWGWWGAGDSEGMPGEVWGWRLLAGTVGPAPWASGCPHPQVGDPVPGVLQQLGPQPLGKEEQKV